VHELVLFHRREPTVLDFLDERRRRLVNVQHPGTDTLGVESAVDGLQAHQRRPAGGELDDDGIGESAALSGRRKLLERSGVQGHVAANGARLVRVGEEREE